MELFIGQPPIAAMTFEQQIMLIEQCCPNIKIGVWNGLYIWDEISMGVSSVHVRIGEAQRFGTPLHALCDFINWMSEDVQEWINEQ